MNNKGFSLIELLLSIAILSILMITFMIVINNTFSYTDEQAYESLKKSIINQVNIYILECDNGIIECKNDYTWSEVENNKETSFNLNTMRGYSYFTENEYINPITNEDIGECLVINVVKNEFSSLEVSLNDSECFK